MKSSTALLVLALLLTACGTRPPLPPECKGSLTPINASAAAPSPGKRNGPERRP